MKTKQTKMELITFSKGDDERFKTYKVSHWNGETRLEQEVMVTKKAFLSGWEVGLDLDGFPKLDAEADALLMLADWLERMGIAIRREARRAIKRGVE
ncbi:TPA: hypothetical protein ACS7WW_003586 [Providencia alcalifaciens]|uniref:hypothetical protein n=1 Tax=Providencia alcalifaciens TaxID=126385 RepID=UPI000560FB32|nr:hypothetical protein [Providencia alcalifaciens]